MIGLDFGCEIVQNDEDPIKGSSSPTKHSVAIKPGPQAYGSLVNSPEFGTYPNHRYRLDSVAKPLLKPVGEEVSPSP